MKRVVSLAMALLLLFTFSACGAPTTTSQKTEAPLSTTLPASAAPTSTAAPASPTAKLAVDPAKAKIAFICQPAGTEAFITQGIDAVKAEAKKYGFTYKVMECATTDDFLNNANGAVQEGYTLIIGLGWMTADAIKKVATDYPDAARYAVIDTTVDNPKVTSLYFDMAEPCYVLGVLMGTIFPNEAAYGVVSSFQTQTTYRQRWGYLEGLKTVNPNAKLIQNFVGSYADPVTAKALALQQVSQGVKVLASMCATPNNAAIANAGLEKPGTIYTTGQEVDTTTSNNKYILSCMLKNTGKTTSIIIDNYFAGTLTPGATLLGLKSGAVGVVHVTTESANYRSEFVTDAAIAAAKAAAQKIISGQLVLNVPEEKK